MPSVGTAYVNIRVNTKSFNTSLEGVMSRLSKQMEAQGASMGKDFERGMKKTNFDNAFKPLTDASSKAKTSLDNNLKSMETSAERAGRNIGDSLAGGGAGAQELADDVKETRREVGGLSQDASRAKRSLSGMGGGGGGMRSAANDASFFSNVLKNLEKDAARDVKALNSLFNTAAFGGTAIAGLVGALSGAAQGIFAIGANAAAAAPSLAIFANGMLSLAQVGGVLGIAMKGVGGALTAGFKAVNAPAASAAKAAQGIGKATAAAARAVRDAKQALQDAYRDAARAAEEAARRTQRAEEDLADAQRETAIAQRNLNAARAEGLEQLEDIAFAAEDAALAEQRAGLDLQDAYQQLLAVSELAPDNRARIEAELAYKEAELNLRQSKDAREDADKAQKESAKKGVEGTDAMIDARSELADAQEREADAARDLADARRNEAEVAEDNARRIRDALQGVADAQRGLADAQRGGAAATTAAAKAADLFGDAMAKLGPEQRKFVRSILAMRDDFQRFRNAIAEPLFQRLNVALKNFVGSGLIGVIQKGLIGTSKALGDTAIQASELAGNPAFKKSLGDAMASNNKAIRNFGSAGVYLADAFVQIADAAGPLFVKFSAWVESVAKGWSETTRLKNRTGELGDTINTAGDRVAEFWGLAKQLWRTLMILGKAANTAANNFGDMGRKSQEQKDKFGYIKSITDSLEKFNDKLEKNPDLVDRFTQALKNLNATASAIKTVFQPFIDMGSDPQIAEAMNTISKSDAFERLGATATDAVPELAEVVVHVADMLANMSESGAIDHFLTILEQVTGALAVFTEALADTGILKWTGYVTAAFAAFKLLKRGLKFVASPFISMASGFKTFMGNMKTARAEGKKPFRTAFKGLFTGPKSAGGQAAGSVEDAKIISAIEVAASSIVTAINTCCGRMVAAMGKGAAADTAGDLLAAPAAGGAAPIGGAALAVPPTGKVGKLAGVFGKLGKVMGPVSKLLKPLSFGLKLLGGAFRFMLGPIGIIAFTVLPLLWPLLVKLEEKTGIFSKALGILTDAFTWLWDNAIKPFFGWLKDNAGKIWEQVGKAFNKAKDIIGGVGDKISDFWGKIQDAFGWIKDNWPTLLAILTGPIGIAVLLITKYWDKIVNGVKSIPRKIRKILSRVWDVFATGLRRVWAAVLRIWGRVVSWVKGRPSQFKKNMALLWSVLSDKLRWVWDKVQAIWRNITTWIKGRPAQFKKNLAGLWDTLKTGLSKAWNWVKEKWSGIKEAIAKWPGQIGDKLSGLWSSIKSGFKKAYNSVAGMVNQYLIGGINNILGVLHVPEISFRLQTLAKGGPVHGPGGPTSDRVLAALSNGEYVLPTRSAKSIGPENLEYMRKHGELPPGTGGIFGSIGNAFSTVASAVTHGAETALKWILDNVTDHLPGGLIGDLVTGLLKSVSGAISAFGKKKDDAAAAAAAAAAGGGAAYTGPPGGWTYPLAHRYGITQYPNSGHNPTWSVDIGAPGGTGVRAASKGVVSLVRDLGGSSYGRYIVISHAKGQQTLYAHLQSFKVKVGSKVKTGQTIGISDSTGHSTGNHLHFELKPSSNTVSAMAAHGVKLGKGGVVAPSAAGTLAVLAEAGRSERVTPLDTEGFTPAERRIIETLEAKMGGGGGDTINVHPSERMDETRLADLVARRVAWKRRRGTGR